MTHIELLTETALTVLDPEGLLHASHESTSRDEVSVVYGLVSEWSKTKSYTKRNSKRISTLKKANEEGVLKTKVTTMTENNLANKFPHRTGSRSHPLINIPTDHYKLCQECMYKEIKVDKETGKRRHYV